MTLLASHYLAAEILTLLMPVGLLVGIIVYWSALWRRRVPGARSGKVQ